MLAWHFVGDTLRDGSPVPPDGKWLEFTGPIHMCHSGLHASIHPFDALQYAPGPILCRVECEGKTLHQSDKLVCSRRKIIQRLDTTEGLYYFARMQALSVAHLWDIPDLCLEYLLTGRNRNAAWAAAWDAARDTAWAAARNAARNAAWAAARAAAWDSARDAAWTAAWAAARTAARTAARNAARADWKALVYEAFNLTQPMQNDKGDGYANSSTK